MTGSGANVEFITGRVNCPGQGLTSDSCVGPSEINIIVCLKYTAIYINVMEVYDILRYCTLTNIALGQGAYKTKNTSVLTFIRNEK